MAIDDNTSYELTGAQVKDLASKIKAKADSSSLATVATSGNYNDLTNQPTIPTVNDATLTIQQNGSTVGTFTANASSNTTVSLTDTTYSAFTGATSGAAGTSGLVPAPAAGDQAKYLKGDGTWGTYDDPMIDEAACAIKPMSNAFAQTLADSYNDAHANPQDPSSYISSLNVKTAIPFMFVNQSGEPISTLSGVRNALRTANRVIYNGTDDKFVSGHSSASGYAKFGLFDPLYSEVKNYRVRAGSSSDTPAFKQYLPYIIVPDEYGSQDAWGYTDGTESADSLIDAPETKYQVAHDANGNLYMSSNVNNTSDWKQISNVSAPTVNDGTLTIQHNGTSKGTFTANQSTASTVNIETIYADTISPATAVDPITTGMIADGAVTSAKIDWSTIMTAVLSTDTVVDGSWTGAKGLNYFKFDNGLMVVTGQTEAVQVNANSHVDKSYNLTTSFTTYPIVVASISTDSNYTKTATVANYYSTKSEIKLRFYNPYTDDGRTPVGTFIAIGMWK